MPTPPSTCWSREEEKALENAVASLPPPVGGDNVNVDAWMREVATWVPGRSLADVRCYYELLVEDVRAIEAGNVPLPTYQDDRNQRDCFDPNPINNNNNHHNPSRFSDRRCFGSLSKFEQERRRGIPWTEEEHKLFLLGLRKYGKGDWRSISRNLVVSRTPTQVASHAQKYFIRLNSMNRDRRRSSIHDITSVGGGDAASPRPGTGAPPALAARTPPPPKHVEGTRPYASVTGHPVPAVGTPVVLPHGHAAPCVIPMAYPAPPPPPLQPHAGAMQR